MKKSLFFVFLSCVAALLACSGDFDNAVMPDHPEGTGIPTVELTSVSAKFGRGTMTVGVTTPEQAKALRRSNKNFGTVRATFASHTPSPSKIASRAAKLKYTAPKHFASRAEGDIESIQKSKTDGNGNTVYYADTLKPGHSYYINGDEQVLTHYFVQEAGDGDITIYINSGAKLSSALNTDNGKVIYYISEGAELTTTTSAKGYYNSGTLNFPNGVYQNATWNGTENVCDQVISNTGTLNCGGTMQINGTLTTDKDLTALIKGGGSVSVGGNFYALDGFGLSGSLVVNGRMSGDININIGLVANVGSVSATSVNITSSSELYVDGDMNVSWLTVDGDSWPGGQSKPSECVVNGTARVTSDVYVASGSYCYFDILECASYTANSSDVYVGCKSIVYGLFEMNGNSNFHLGDGVYLYAGSANFAASTYMSLGSSAFFEVGGNLQLNNADTNELSGTGSETAIVKATTIGANYEDFSKTFTGNIGVDFETWNYYSSTGLINQNTGLKTLSGIAAGVVIPSSECNPGYEKADIPTTYDVYYVVEDEDGTYIDIENGEYNEYLLEGIVGEEVCGAELDLEELGLTFKSNDYITLTDNPDENIAYVVYKVTQPEIDEFFGGCDIQGRISIPLGLDSQFIIQPDDFAIHNGDYLYESIADITNSYGNTSINGYIAVNGAGSEVSVDLADICEIYEFYKDKSKICDDNKSVYFGDRVYYVNRNSKMLTLETYIWPGKFIGNSIYSLSAAEMGLDESSEGEYLLGGRDSDEYKVWANDDYYVTVSAYKGLSGGGNHSQKTAYIKVSIHIEPRPRGYVH